MVFHAGLIVLLIAWVNLIVRSNLTSKGSGSMASFLFYGDWVKDVNLFSICSVILLVGLAYLVNVISELARKAFLLWSTGFSPQKCPVPAVHAVLKD